ncbi:hypothetical protein EDB84DRAFT_1477791 [Lactarius hengduanensis]|nr:hypothetical protein EDB84DRAFT_1477791 [Lactarius hengduanensis]
MDDGRQLNAIYLPSPLSHSPLGLSLAIDDLPLCPTSDIVDLTLDDVDCNTDAVILFASRLPSPFLVPAISSALPPTIGSKTLGTSVFTPDFVISPIPTSPTNNLDSSIDTPDSPPQRQNQRNVVTPTADDDDKALFASRHPATVSVSPSVDHINNKRTPHGDAPVQPQSPRHAHVFPPNACERPRDPDEVEPTTPQSTSRHSRASTAEITPHPQNVATRNCNRHAHVERHVWQTAVSTMNDHRTHSQNVGWSTHSSKTTTPRSCKNQQKKIAHMTKIARTTLYNITSKHRLRIVVVVHRPSQPFHHIVIQYATMAHEGTRPQQIGASQTLAKENKNHDYSRTNKSRKGRMS